MNIEQWETIKETINLIDRKIKEDISLDEISKDIGISKFYLHRLFKSITGKSLINYVRRRRMSLSAKDLLNTNFKIIDIAHEYGYKQENSYIRAFEQMFKISPAQYRKLKCELDIEPTININEHIHIGQGLLIRPSMCLKPQFYVQGIRTEIVHEINLIEQQTTKLAIQWRKEYLHKVKNAVNKEVYIGLILYSSHPEYSNDYVTGVEVSKLGDVTFPMTEYVIPTHEYAVFKYIGLHSPYEITFATIKGLYDYIGTWLQKSSYCEEAPFHFEKIDLSICNDHYCEMEIYYTIKNKY